SEHIVERTLGSLAQPGQRQRFQRSRVGSVWCSLPIYMIENIADSAERTTPHSGDTDGAEPVHQNTRFAGFIIKTDASLDELIRALDHTCPDPRRRSGRAKKQDPSKSDRQFKLRAARFDRRTAGGKHV